MVLREYSRTYKGHPLPCYQNNLFKPTTVLNRLLLLLLLSITGAATVAAQDYSRRADILLQGFNWDSHANRTGWYDIVRQNAGDIADAGFSMVWLPPPSDAAAPQGYLPRELYDLDTRYGTQAQLRQAIDALHGRNVKVLADIVINHRVGSTNWADFTNPTWGCWAVTRNDEWGQNGGTPCGDYDTGDNYHAARDVNHRDERVRSSLISWMNWLKNDNNAGFDGWRYDYVRGFNGGYVNDYNSATDPYFSVGELWDNLDLNDVNAHRQQIVNWIDQAGGRTAAFDFTTKGVLQAAVDNQYWRLKVGNGPAGVIGWWPSRAVTFVDNHDTGSSQNYWPFPGGKVMQGYAYILTHPGVPSVFWDHYFDWGLTDDIRELMRVRKDNGIHSESPVNILEARGDLYAAIIDNKVAMKIGPGSWWPGTGWTLRASGNDYAVWERNGAKSLPSHDSQLIAEARPNPASGSTELQLQLPAAGRYTIRLLDLNGRRLRTVTQSSASKAGSQRLSLDLADYPPGVYLIRVGMEKHFSTTKLIIR